MFYVEVFRDGGWHVVGQYKEKRQAEAIAKDYKGRGEKARVARE